MLLSNLRRNPRHDQSYFHAGIRKARELWVGSGGLGYRQAGSFTISAVSAQVYRRFVSCESVRVELSRGSLILHDERCLHAGVPTLAGRLG